MLGNLKRLDAFGARVRDAQDAALQGPGGTDALRKARALWLSTPSASKAGRGVARGRPRIGAIAVLAAAACGVVLAATVRVFVPAERSASLTFQVGPSERSLAPGKGTAAPGAPGQWVAAATAERLPLRFSDGSLVRLEPSARARVVEVTDVGGRVALESGTVHAEIVHRERTRWSVDAGPFQVRVTGTQFDVAWDPSYRQLTISLLEGSVAVSGCDLAHPRVVTAGETFQTTCDADARASAEGPPSAVPTPARPTEAPPTVAPRASQAASATPPAATSAGFAPPEGARWRDVLALGRYAEALRLAEAEGLSSVCASADVGTLMQLGDAARFAGRSDRAEVILLAVRRRFPGDSRAATAAFDLGRIAFDDDASFADAARWFERYLTELPDGQLAREASGRRMEALEKSGDHVAAARAAKVYLENYPTGPHAQLARSIDTR